MQLQRYYEVSQAPDIESFRRLLSRFVADMGFGLFSAFLVMENPLDKKAPVVHSVNNVPETLAAALSDRAFVDRDPIIKQLKMLSVPVIYDQELYVAERAGDIWEMQAPYGYKTGISVALHLSNHRHFVMGVDRDMLLPISDGELSRMMADLQLLATHSFEASMRLMLPMLQPRFSKLSNRELEVLKWTLDGKQHGRLGCFLVLVSGRLCFMLIAACTSWVRLISTKRC